MLEVLFNDSATTLSLVNVVDNEGLAIVDTTFHVYATISYNPFEPTNEDLESLWDKSLKDYLSLDDKTDDTLIKWRKSVYEISNKNFKEFLMAEQEKKGGN